METVFISECKKKYICTSNGCPCFTRTTHQQLISQKGLNMQAMENLTFAFYYTGKGKSIREFLNT